MEVSQAMNLMKFVKRGASLDVYKTLKSGKANALVKYPDVKELFIKKIVCDNGPQLKRWKAISRGRASKILKRTTHLTVVLTDVISKGGEG
jgi:large subunit ribosomal protein L22